MLGLTPTSSPFFCPHLGSAITSAGVSEEHPHLTCESYQSLPVQRYTLGVQTSSKGLAPADTSTLWWPGSELPRGPGCWSLSNQAPLNPTEKAVSSYGQG